MIIVLGKVSFGKYKIPFAAFLPFCQTVNQTFTSENVSNFDRCNQSFLSTDLLAPPLWSLGIRSRRGWPDWLALGLTKWLNAWMIDRSAIFLTFFAFSGETFNYTSTFLVSQIPILIFRYQIDPFYHWNPHSTVEKESIWGSKCQIGIRILFWNRLSYSHRPEQKEMRRKSNAKTSCKV